MNDWTKHAECRGATKAFYPPDADRRQRSARAAAAVAAAKAVCAICPVQAECLQHALDEGEDDGIWGGLTGEERRPLLRRIRPRSTVLLPSSRLQQPLQPINHGTSAGYAAHHRRNENACQPCLDANAAYHRDRRQAAS